MAINGDNQVAIIAGGTGLVGGELTKLLLDHAPIAKLYALSRKPLPYYHNKLELIQDPYLRITDWEADKASPTLGFICLGSTRKQAGSKKALASVDFELVREVAKSMKTLGVKRLAVISSYGANARSPSHYLKCKGRMEAVLSEMGFDQLVIARPGPLRGLRDQPRTDETVVQTVLSALKPVMRGRLANFVPIDAEKVAKAMLYAIYEPMGRGITILDSNAIRHLLNKYQ
ncbi:MULTISPECIES: NAD(P)H-binding protein [unclassified Vibrio]|uniref:NAD(P)H-binding protein n=1 Tax=unclassified Vibrio TaxID=2614977 RepID=UPI001360FDE2|nr:MULTISPECIES: NAD(P)H-binding protein [unclassified Vibrio]NAW58684.1 NAD(P)H-binding protein [Vibrio sp. V36_P2S2PM302]NAX25147.1 NAD(P)H-binding protein [Vibrio sp. V38_P2S17PM301]NAX31585.1 NAD(P)H-binding protein [Vibrio sp. V37_P2S8PM304]